MKDIYFAGGCFWGIEEYFSRIEGVTDTEVGYANSKVENPSYELVCSGMTDSAETVKIIYDENIISLENLLEKLFLVIDPTLLNRQGNDIGSQYRTGIYYNNDEDFKLINSYIDKIRHNYDKDILTEVLKIKNFYPAEEYHQDYLKKNPNGYCHIKLD